MEVERCVLACAAIAAALASQSFAETNRTPAPKLVPVLAAVQSVFPEVKLRRNIGDKLNVLFELLLNSSYSYSAADEKPASALTA